nr:hypothetical protein [Paraburkholderia aromaticivorans]
MAYLDFAVSQGAQQIVLQQLHFQLFSSSAVLGGLLLTSLAGLGYFVYHSGITHAPSCSSKACGKECFWWDWHCTVLLFFDDRLWLPDLAFSRARSVIPVENAGWFVGVTSLFSVLMLSAYFRYSSRVVHKKWLIVPGFGIAAAAAWIMTRMPPDASQPALLVPLVLQVRLSCSSRCRLPT